MKCTELAESSGRAPARIAALEFNPVNPLAGKKSWSINNRDHRKLLVVDVRAAFIGGVNISSGYSSGSVVPKTENATEISIHWRDTHLQIEGPVVAELQKLFLDTWRKQFDPDLAARNYFPQLKPEGEQIARAIGSTPDDPYSLIYLTLISAIGNTEQRMYLTHA